MKKIKLNIQMFSSTNKTANLELSQYTANDKPTYLVDYNSDMNKIDTGVHNVDTKATTNQTNIGTMSNLTTTEKSTLVGAINEVKSSTVANATNIANNTTNIGPLANLDTINKNNLVVAINEIVGKFNINTFKNNLQFTVTLVDGTAPTINTNNTRLSSAHNSDGSIGKIYGMLSLNGAGSGLSHVKITSSDTGLRPFSDITLDGCTIMSVSRPSVAVAGATVSRTITYTLKTNGTIEINNFPIWNDEQRNISFIACLIFASNFGDTPVTPE